MNSNTLLRYITISLLAICLALPVHASVFTLNSSDADVNDIIWNSTDEYSPYLTYVNPYADACDDLRFCFLDNTNSPSGLGVTPDTSFIINSWLSGYDNPVAVFQKQSFKVYYNGIPYSVSHYYDNTTDKYYTVSQRGTVVDVYEKCISRFLDFNK